jgi:hypothetical protein
MLHSVLRGTFYIKQFTQINITKNLHNLKPNVIQITFKNSVRNSKKTHFTITKTT